MSTTARLDNVTHAALRLRTGHGAEFGDAVNQTLLFVSEFEAAQREYPILFRKEEDGSLQALAILGLDRDENLFLEGGSWTAHYVPALFRRGPFLIGTAPNGEPVIHVDLAHPRIAAAGEAGAALFLPHGGQAPALEAALDALRAIHIGSEAAPVMSALFGELGLVEPITLQVQLSDTESYDFDGYHAVTFERIGALDGAALERLSAAGLLDIAIFASSSLGNIAQLIKRKNRRRAAGG